MKACFINQNAISGTLDQAEYNIKQAEHRGGAAQCAVLHMQQDITCCCPVHKCSPTRGSAEQLPPYLVAIVNIEAGCHGGCQEVAPIWSPVTCHCHIIPASSFLCEGGQVMHKPKCQVSMISDKFTSVYQAGYAQGVYTCCAS